MPDKPQRYRVGIVGNRCSYGEFVAVALKAELGADLEADWGGLRASSVLKRRRGVLAEAIDPNVEIVALDR